VMNNGIVYSQANKAMGIDGVDDYVLLPAGLQSSVYSAISVSAWVKIANGSQQYSDFGGDIIHNSVDSTVMNSTYLLAVTTTGAAVWGWSGNYSQTTTASLFNDGGWHNLIGTWNGLNSKLYVDGSLLKEGYTNVNRSGSAGNLNIGGAQSSYRVFNGLISNISVSNKDLSDSEVKQNFNTQRGRYGL